MPFKKADLEIFASNFAGKLLAKISLVILLLSFPRKLISLVTRGKTLPTK